MEEPNTDSNTGSNDEARRSPVTAPRYGIDPQPVGPERSDRPTVQWYSESEDIAENGSVRLILPTGTLPTGELILTVAGARQLHDRLGFVLESARLTEMVLKGEIRPKYPEDAVLIHGEP